ncbi:cysteine dioxygenase [Pseudomonas monteilii]|jgi:predicted metal-dependent enzyme (double-stranded beta helix superfamily)|uniref:cysteine dioxygenase family protein n=1 Tax=Pseudomonas TaxID=286 RepID=UPI0004036DB3|nr:MULTISPECIES: cysteine dioxygenase [Pseudomonas]MBB3270047.1 putative metal-dependent enzyme (double-stranded beta helix superfamily) [Pseudomonas sp. OG7]MBH3396703.1 cysteine dioxygenase [Pseudomonas monteilii]MBH3457648.1 cysteine dioxygenase [Pseudomonas monteilii]PXX68084.1 putative metal-dependent enzyme (double-stranded beta helix superfamily) [Pseudomonas sp. LAIL14HWK12:I1]SNB76599.1 Predicted metal-dependent enzyme of the double-stranded beta helix superfamily [Pseudomonas sp. URI
MSHNPERLRHFIDSLAELLEQQPDEATLLDRGRGLLASLVAQDDWLPDDLAQPDPHRYQQYLLHCDSRQRFSVVSFVWGPGQRTPIHDHRVWGLIGMLRGAEYSQNFTRDAQGALQPSGAPVRLAPGQVEAVSPRIGDIHQVSNAFSDQVSISIHVYGGNIGAVKRAVYAEDGSEKAFISGYSNTRLPNIWDLSKENPAP